MAPFLCDNRGYVRALQEDDFGFPDKVVTLAELTDAILGRCRHCGAGWESGSCVGDRQARAGPLTG